MQYIDFDMLSNKFVAVVLQCDYHAIIEVPDTVHVLACYKWSMQIQYQIYRMSLPFNELLIAILHCNILTRSTRHSVILKYRFTVFFNMNGMQYIDLDMLSNKCVP